MNKESEITISNPPSTLCQLLFNNCREYSYDDLLSSKIEGKWTGISSCGLARTVESMTLGLFSLGVKTGDHVAIYAENSPQWVIADFAITCLGAVTVPLYITQVESQIEYILKDAGVMHIFVSGESLLKRISNIVSRLGIKSVIAFNKPPELKGVISAAELRQLGEHTAGKNSGLFKKLAENVRPDSIASLIYTSGTTGEPKGVVLTHRNLVSNAIDASSIIHWMPGTDVAFSFLPLSHIFERTMINIYLYRGLKIYFAESIESISSNLPEVKPTVMSSVPRMLEKVYDRIIEKGTALSGMKKLIFNWSIRLADKYDYSRKGSMLFRLQLRIASFLVFKKWREALGGRLRFVISGGAPLQPKLAQIFMAAGIPVVQGYGLTETSPVIAVNNVNSNRIGSVGKPIPNVEVKIAEDGEILTRGPHVMKEFYNSPEATACVFQDGWFCTGDIGYLDKDGFLFVTDRKKELIKKSSGKFIAPAPIENKLRQSPFVEFAALIGERRKFVLAMIFPNFIALSAWALKNELNFKSHEELLNLPEVSILYQKIIDALNTELNPWERIIKFLLIEQPLSIDTNELTPTLKLKRRVVESKYKDRIDSVYEKFEHLHDLHESEITERETGKAHY
ncbi:MAG: AMP-dependent synthetase/ligase [Syntrophothermus sp.]